MNKRQKIIVSVTGIFIVLLALVGLTYAYFLTQIRGNEETKSISVTTANLILEYGDGDGNVALDNIVASTSGYKEGTKTFTVTNRGNETVENYNVYLENVINQLELKEDLRYKLTCVQVKTTDYEAWLELPDEDLVDIVEEVEPCNGASSFTTFPSVMSVLTSNTIDEGYTHYYELDVRYMYRDYDQSVDMNKTVQAKVNIYDGKTKFLSPEIINNTTLNKTNNSTTGTLYTLPNELPTKIAEEISGENEKILSYTLDDLGTSYYYRGNVNDNYVNFAGKCWRIVRIEGDGSVKLILEDKNTTCDNAGYTGNWSLGGGNYGYHYTTNPQYYKASYLNPVTNADKSMSKVYYDFQNTFSTEEIKKLKVGDWCLGDVAYTKNGNIYTQVEEFDKNVATYYDAYARLYGDNINGYQPTLKCNGTKLNNFQSVLYDNEQLINAAPMYVGGITVDELVYTGGKLRDPNANWFIYNNFQNNSYHFWSITYSNYIRSGIDKAFFIRSNSILFHLGVNTEDDTTLIRPMISLISTSNVTTKTDTATYGEPGTINNPYVIG